ncbi:hypothetical protein ACVWZ6_005959 [Bradyrhizobium sp. GM6.1]
MAVKTVDEDADAGDHHHGDAGDRLRLPQAQSRFPADRAGCDQQEHRVRQRRQDGGGAQAIGEAAAGRAPRRDRRAPGHDQAEHVAKIMAGIRKQSRGVADIAVDGLRRDQRGVE